MPDRTYQEPEPEVITFWDIRGREIILAQATRIQEGNSVAYQLGNQRLTLAQVRDLSLMGDVYKVLEEFHGEATCIKFTERVSEKLGISEIDAHVSADRLVEGKYAECFHKGDGMSIRLLPR